MTRTFTDALGQEIIDNLFGKDYNKFFVGFGDNIAKINGIQREIAKNMTAYPPYNVRKTGENNYVIELAVAGFAKQDLEIELEANKLTITGNSSVEVADSDFLVRGVAMRPFTRTFAIGDQLEYKSAELVNGLLRIWLEALIPDNKKSRKIKLD